MCNSRKFRRFMALLLTIVMVFGTVGTTADAIYSGQTSLENPISPGPGNYNGAFFTSLYNGNVEAEGIRYSLVKVDKSAIQTQITSFDDYQTLGTYDAVSSELYSALNSSYKYYSKSYFTSMRYDVGGSWVQRLNALDYEVGVSKYGSSFLTNVEMYGWDSTALGSGNARDIGTLDTFYNQAVQIYGVYYGEGTSEYDEHVANLNACKSDFLTTFQSSEENALLKMTTSESLESVSGEDGRYVAENNELLNALVMVLSATPYLDDSGVLSANNVNNILTAEDFIAEGDDYCYRILAEPTCVTFCSTNEFYLTTVRDMFALQEVYYLSQSPLTGYTGYWDGTLLGAQNIYILGKLMYVVDQTADEFVDYDKTMYTNTLNADQSNVDEALGKAIAKWKEDYPNATPAFTAFELGYYFPDTGGQTFRIERAILQNSNEQSVKGYAAYSLGILAPYNYVVPTNDPGEVVIIKTDAGSGAKLQGATFTIEDTDGSLTLEKNNRQQW